MAAASCVSLPAETFDFLCAAARTNSVSATSMRSCAWSIAAATIDQRAL
jgi:hypothetical protein